MIGIAFALFSAAISGLGVVLTRKVSGESDASSISLVITLIGTLVMWPIAFMTADLGNVNFEGVFIFALAGALAPGLARPFYYKGMKSIGASANASIYATYPMYSSTLAIFLLGETLSPLNFIGIFFIVLGVVAIQRVHYGVSAGAINYKSFLGKSLLVPMAGTLIFAMSQIVKKQGLNVYNEPVLGAAIGYSFALLLNFLFFAVSETRHHSLSLRSDLKLLWKVGLGISISWILSFYAVSFEQVSVVTPILQVEPLFILFFAYVYLKGSERISSKIVLSVLLILLGVALLGYKTS